MTRGEALREIGVAPGSSQGEIRRAYLRLVKTRKPETDPEGFRRLREAYELLCELPEQAPEIHLHPRSAEKRPAHPKAEPEEITEAEKALPHPRHIVRLILQLQAEGQAAEAERIQERYQRRLWSFSQELSLLDDQTAALWQIAREISGLSADFSTSTRAAISSAVLRGAPTLAIPRLLAQVGEDGDTGWRMAAEIKDLPGLGSLYHHAMIEALKNRNQRRRSPAKKTSWHPGQVGALLIGLWFLAQLSGVFNTPVPSPPPKPLYPELPSRHSATASSSLEEAMVMPCLPGVPSPGRSDFCRAARAAVSNLRQRRCRDVRETRAQLLEGLQMMQGSAFAQPAEALIASIRAEYSVVCQDDAF